MDSATNEYLREINKTPYLEGEEFKKIFYKYRKTRSPKLKTQIINSYTKLVVHIAEEFYKKHYKDVELQDLIDEGIIGLIIAIDKFRIYKKASFANYASRWIKNKIMRFLKEKSSSIEIPYHLLDLVKKWVIECQNSYKRFGRYPTIKEMEKKLDIPFRSAKRVLHLLNSLMRVSSLDSTIDEDGETTLGDMVSDNTLSPEEFISLLTTKKMLGDAIKCLTPKESTIIKLRFGLDTRYPEKLSYRKIAQMLHNTQEAVRFTEKKAMKKLRNYVLTKI